jgi:hypothetical protein
MRFLTRLVDDRDYNEHEKREYNRVMAALLSVGVLMALIRIRPRAIDWTRIERSTHPPAALRAIWISIQTSEAIKIYFGNLSEAERRWVRIIALELSAQGTITSNSEEEKIFRKRAERGEPAALRVVGIRGALFDPQVQSYIGEIRRSLDVVRARLQPRKRAASAGDACSLDAQV